MAKTNVVMPQMGESITNGTITKWNKKVGDTVAVDEILLEISTDKVESEIPSPIGGKVVNILYPEGATVDVGLKIAEIDDDISASVSSSSSSSEKVAAPKKEERVLEKVVKESTVNKAASDQPKVKRFYTPLVKAMAKKEGIDLNELSSIKGSGTAGRVNRDDLVNYMKTRGKITPSEAVNLSTPSIPVYNKQERVEIIPIDNMRKTIARNMVESKKISPHVNSIGEIDMTHLVKFREEFKDAFFKREGFKLTYSPFIIRALIMALQEFPKVNASFDGENIYLKKDINLGVAVAVPGNGLVVPVIKNANTLNMTGLCRALDVLANKARAKKLTVDDLQGGTFTFTNVGSFGTLMATPIILQPQLGIYASGVIQKRPVVINDDAIAIRSMMYGTHTYDHRLVDGELGGKFLEATHQFLREMKPETLF